MHIRLHVNQCINFNLIKANSTSHVRARKDTPQALKRVDEPYKTQVPGPTGSVLMVVDSSIRFVYAKLTFSKNAYRIT